MSNRLSMKTPRWDSTFSIKNGSATKTFTWWECPVQYEDVWRFKFSTVRLSDILQLVGSHSRLSIDGWSGILAPMDVEPIGWTYPGGHPIEPECFWQWTPDEQSASEIVETLNTENIMFGADRTPFKGLIPFQSQRNQGEVLRVDAIEIMRLPGMVKKEATWLFEWEN